MGSATKDCSDILLPCFVFPSFVFVHLFVIVLWHHLSVGLSSHLRVFHAYELWWTIHSGILFFNLQFLGRRRVWLCALMEFYRKKCSHFIITLKQNKNKCCVKIIVYCFYDFCFHYYFKFFLSHLFPYFYTSCVVFPPHNSSK